MLGGFNMSSALMSARSPDWNRRLLALNAVGWAAAFFLGYAMTPFWYLMFGGVLYSPVIVWLVIAILGTLVHLTMISQLNKGRIA
jgi:hypothetical protein